MENNAGSFYSNGETAITRGITNETTKSLIGGNISLKSSIPNSGKCKIGDVITIVVEIDNKSKMVFLFFLLLFCYNFILLLLFYFIIF